MRKEKGFLKLFASILVGLSMLFGAHSAAPKASETQTPVKVLQTVGSGTGTIGRLPLNASGSVTSFNTRVGAVTSQSGDYNTGQVAESGNLYFTNGRAIGSTLTGYTSGAGTVSSSDSILSALQKLDGNTALKFTLPALTAGSSLFSDGSTIAQDNANYFYDSINHNLRIGPTSAAISTENRLSVIGNANDYHGIFTQNKNAGNLASTDMVVGNDLTTSDPTTFADFGVNSSTNANPSYTAFGASDAYLFTSGQVNNLNIGTGSVGKILKFFTGGTLAANERARVTDTQFLSKVQLSWATGLGAINHILGPPDNALNINSANAVAVTTAVAGNALNFTSGNATAGSTVGSAAAGGPMSFVTGNAANNTSASARGGDWSVLTGTGIGGAGSGNISLLTGIAGGTGTIGSVSIKTADGTAGTNNPGGPITLQTGSTNATAGPINIVGGTPQVNGSATSKGGLLNLISGAGVQKTGGLSGDGGTSTLATGAGGLSPITGAGATGIGANAGLLSLLGGAGGNATGAGAGGTFTGGNGASINVTTGNGGNATGASGTRTGGNSGSLIFTVGSVGTGATANGSSGYVNFTGANVGINNASAVSRLEINGRYGTSIRTITGTTTLDNTYQTVLCDATSGAVTVNLPTAASAFNSPVGAIYDVIKIDASINACTVTRAGADTINGAATDILTIQYQSHTIQSAGGTAWYIE